MSTNLPTPVSSRPSSPKRSLSNVQTAHNTFKTTTPQIQTKLHQMLQPKLTKATTNAKTPLLATKLDFPFSRNSSMGQIRTRAGSITGSSTKLGNTPTQSIVFDQSTVSRNSPYGNAKKRASVLTSFDASSFINPGKRKFTPSSTMSTNFTGLGSVRRNFAGLKEEEDQILTPSPSTNTHFFPGSKDHLATVRSRKTITRGEEDIHTHSPMTRRKLSTPGLIQSNNNLRTSTMTSAGGSLLNKRLSLSLIDSLGLDDEDRQAVEDYSQELLGIYYKQSGISMKGKEAQRRSAHINRLLQALMDRKRRAIILTLLLMRTKVKRYIKTRDMVPMVEEITDVMFIAIETNDIFLFMETLHLIADTYLMFGDIENTIFAFNQLRLACELVNDIKRKIKALVGLAEAAKRLFKMEEAARIFLKAMQYAWYSQDHEAEMDLYDQIGLIYYHVGDMERASYYHEQSLTQKGCDDVNLLRLSKFELDMYMEGSHSKHQTINMAFFSKLSLPHYRTAKSTTSGAKVFDFKTPLLSGGNTDRDESPLAKLAKRHPELNSDLKGTKDLARYSTTIPVKVQMDLLMEDLEFSRTIPSPRSFQKEDDSKYYSTSKSHQKEGLFIKSQLRRINEHTTKKSNDYSLNKLFGDNVPLKDLDKKIQKRLETDDSKVDFWTIKRQLLTEYKTADLNGRMFFNHLSPNRNIQGFRNAYEFSMGRFTSFFKRAMEHTFNYNY